ncbi:SGNH/GDSL hydrolase family protein [Actinophytocola sp.]|uniref:SGNH/GDSL hydrolase family protein n=1 Tax=Actinophytocola sp. TaxID=1872138 RepID=UPI0025C47AAB|nr:SGNH/GDSL hydrolase family protein [Actinophytocola sp.]
MYSRYVALGDSQTEGIGDGDEVGGYRGWADRLAAALAGTNPELLYANLAVRGKLAGEVRAEQLGSALALEPDLATVVAGLNDLLRPKFDVPEVVGHLEAMFAALTGAGATVATVTFPNIGKITPLARPLVPRVLALNAAVRAAATRHRVRVVEAFSVEVTTDSRIWSADRLHASPVGHALIAAAMAHVLELPGSDDSWTQPLPVLPRPGLVRATGTELRWIANFFGPWIGRRIRGVSSGTGRTAKRPDLGPVLLDEVS